MLLAATFVRGIGVSVYKKVPAKNIFPVVTRGKDPETNVYFAPPLM